MTKQHDIRIQLINIYKRHIVTCNIAFIMSTNFSDLNLEYLVKLVSIDHL